ncbi:MAG TPA: aspartate--tRNA(Asn) ligase, partial [Candidatus Nanopusillus sp.]|nr:aspartate--tRNA(Asn) ligase [Candidatus Nanopusillus sp.]
DIPKSIPRISLKEAYKILGQLGKKLKYGSDLDSESERLLGKYFMEEYNEPIVFITNYPWSERPFYHMRLEEDPFWTKSFDIFYKGLEISTGAQREHRFEVLLKQAKEKNVPLEPLKYYLETFKYGMPPHGGFGLGIDRFVKQLLDLKDIREAVLWFRDPEHLSP